MSWATLASNEAFTFTEAQGSGIGTKLDLPTSDECMSKNDCLTYLNNDTSVSSFAALASNELATKADIGSLTFSNTGTLYFYQYNGACVLPSALIQIGENEQIEAKLLSVGDMVYTYNQKTGLYGLYKINFVKRDYQKTITLYFDNESRTYSEHHLLFVNDTFIPLFTVKPRDIITLYGETKQVISVFQNEDEVEVIEFSIDEAETYIADGVLSHNKTAFIDGWSTAAGGCSGWGTNALTVYWNGTIGNGTALYRDSAGTYVRCNNTSTYFYMGGYTFTSSNDYSTGTVTLANYTACTFTVTYSVSNVNAGLNASCQIYHNGSLYDQTSGNPATGISGNFSSSSGDTIRVVVTVTGTTGYTQTITITGGASFSASDSSDSGIDSGTLTVSSATSITVDLS